MADILKNVAAEDPDGVGAGAGVVGGATSTTSRASSKETGSSDPTSGGTGGSTGGETDVKFLTFADFDNRVYRASFTRSPNEKMAYSVINRTLELTKATWLSRSSEGEDFKSFATADFSDKIGGQQFAPPPFYSVAYDEVNFNLTWFVLNTTGTDYLQKDLQLQIGWKMNDVVGTTTSGLFAVFDPNGNSNADAEVAALNSRLRSEMLKDRDLAGVEKTTGSSDSGDVQDGGDSPNPSQTSIPNQSNGKGKGGGGLSTGAKAGIGVGAALGALLLIGVLVWFLLRRRRQKKDLDSGYKGQQSSNTYMVDKETQGRVTESPTSPYLDDSQGQRVPLTDIETARDAPATHAPYEDTPAPRSSLGSHGERGTGTQTPQGVSTNVAHLVEEGMTADEIRRLEEEERQLDDEIERAARR